MSACFTLSLACTATADPLPLRANDFRIVQWTAEDGLPQRSVNAIEQTRDGYIWLGTFDGLARFNGVEFTVFDIANTVGLSGNRILTLFEDSRGALWIGTERNGVCVLRDGVFARVEAPELASSIVTRFAEDDNGDIWLTSWKGLFRYDSATHALVGPIGGAHVARPVFVDSRGRIWTGDDWSLLEYDQGELHKRGHIPNGIWDIDEARDGSLWIASELGVHRYQDGQLSPPLPGAPQVRCRALLANEGGGLWFGSADGLFLNAGPELLQPALQSVLNREQVGKEVRSLLLDHEGGVWVGTDGGGLYRVSPARVTVLRFGPPSYKALLPDGGNGVLMAFGCDGVFRIDARGNLELSSPTLSIRCSNDLSRGPDGALWAPDDRYVVRWDGAMLQRFPVGQETRSLAWDADGALLLGGPAGLLRLQDGALSTLLPAARLHGTQGVVKVVPSRDGTIWFGVAGGGLGRLDDGGLTLFDKTHGLQAGEVRAIYEAPEGALWIGTYGGGLSRFVDGEFTRITTRNGLHDDAVSCIIPDEQGHLWINSNRGAFRVSLDALNGFADGRLESIHCAAVDSGEGNGSSGCRTPDGRIWFPTLDGVSIIDSANFRVNDAPPKVLVEGLTVAGRSIPIAESVNLDPGARDLEIRFAALSFADPSSIRYRYRLQGYDDDWIDAGARRSAFYTNLPPGRYEFRVIASNNDGIWNKTGATLPMRLRPHFYQTRWFAGVGIVMAVLLLLALHLFRTYRIRAAKSKLEVAVTDRTRELRDSEDRYRRLAAELERRVLDRTRELDMSNDALKHQRQRLRALASESRLAEERERRRLATGLHDSVMQDLALVKLQLQGLQSKWGASRTGALETAVQTLDKAIRESRSLVFELSPPILYECGLVAAIEWLAERSSAQSGIAHDVHAPKALESMTTDLEVLLFQIVRELLVNVRKHSRATRVDVFLRMRGSRVEIEVHDDGVGFDPQRVEPTRETMTGFGLFSIRERITPLGGEFHVDGADGIGTRVSVTMPVHSSLAREGARGVQHTSDRRG